MTDTQNLKIVDFSKVAQDALSVAQFCFPMRPMSVNEAYIPVPCKQTGRSRVILSAAAVSYKKQIVTMLWNQKKLQQWDKLDRTFSLWVMVRNDQNCDIDNCHKLIQDAFADAGMIPNDRNAMDTRQMFADFSRCNRIPKTAKFVVLIRWGDLIKKKG